MVNINLPVSSGNWTFVRVIQCRGPWMDRSIQYHCIGVLIIGLCGCSGNLGRQRQRTGWYLKTKRWVTFRSLKGEVHITLGWLVVRGNHWVVLRLPALCPSMPVGVGVAGDALDLPWISDNSTSGDEGAAGEDGAAEAERPVCDQEGAPCIPVVAVSVAHCDFCQHLLWMLSLLNALHYHHRGEHTAQRGS